MDDHYFELITYGFKVYHLNVFSDMIVKIKVFNNSKPLINL